MATHGLVGEVLPIALLGGLAYFGIKVLGDVVPSVESSISGKLASATPGVAAANPTVSGPSGSAATGPTDAQVATFIGSCISVPPTCQKAFIGIFGRLPNDCSEVYQWALNKTTYFDGSKWNCPAS